MTLAAVSDSGPLIHLAEIDSLGLLFVFDEFFVPETVYAEIEAGGVPTGLDDLSYELVEADVDTKETSDLDAGESAAITVAREREITLLTDDLAARRSASDDRIDVHGSVGVISLAHGQGRLDADEAARRMRALQRDTSLFITDAVIESGIELLDETE